MREVGGFAAAYCPVEDVEAWRHTVARLLDERREHPRAVDVTARDRHPPRGGVQLVALRQRHRRRSMRGWPRPSSREGGSVLRVTHIGKFYPPVPGGMERVVQSLCAVTKGRLDNHVLAFNTTSRTIEEVVDGVAVTRVGTWGSAGSVPVAPGFPSHLSSRRRRRDDPARAESVGVARRTPPSGRACRWRSGSTAM